MAIICELFSLLTPVFLIRIWSETIYKSIRFSSLVYVWWWLFLRVYFAFTSKKSVSNFHVVYWLIPKITVEKFWKFNEKFSHFISVRRIKQELKYAANTYEICYYQEPIGCFNWYVICHFLHIVVNFIHFFIVWFRQEKALKFFLNPRVIHKNFE